MGVFSFHCPLGHGNSLDGVERSVSLGSDGDNSQEVTGKEDKKKAGPLVEDEDVSVEKGVFEHAHLFNSPLLITY